MVREGNKLNHFKYVNNAMGDGGVTLCSFVGYPEIVVVSQTSYSLFSDCCPPMSFPPLFAGLLLLVFPDSI